ncbi:MAG: hypothetical protein GXO86_13550 [Chlorobi bacterium]|nr:hypothetical protein [Chlorobiota bacterium]
MKKLTLTAILFLLLPLFSFSQDYWEHLYTNDTNMIWTMKIANNGTIYYGSSNGLYISHDDGQTWAFKYLFEYSYMYDMEFDIDSNLICAASYKLYKYKVAEDEWEFLFQPEVLHDFRAILVDSNFIFAGNDNGNLYRYDGYNWQELETQPVAGITDIIKDTADRLFTCSTSWSGDDGSVAQSLDNGDTWTLLGLKNSYIQDLAIDGQNRLYAGSIGNSQYGIGGLYRYDRESGTWDTLRLYHRVMSILINDEDSLYIGQYTTGGPPAGAFMSPDYGETWYDISSGFPEDNYYKNVMELTIGPQNHLYSIIQNANSIYKSTDSTIVGLERPNYSGQFALRVFPNPFSSQLLITLNNKSFGYCNVSIFNQFST